MQLEPATLAALIALVPIVRVLISAIRNTGKLPDAWTQVTALGIGVLIAVFGSVAPWTRLGIYDAVVLGILAGGAATGLYELEKNTHMPWVKKEPEFR